MADETHARADVQLNHVRGGQCLCGRAFSDLLLFMLALQLRWFKSACHTQMNGKLPSASPWVHLCGAQWASPASQWSPHAPKKCCHLILFVHDGHSQSCCPPAAGEAVASSTHIRAQTHTRVLLTCTGYTCACTRQVLLTCTHVRSETPRFSKIQNIGQARRQFSHRLGGGRPTNKQINASAF